MSKPQTWQISGTIKIKEKYNKVSKSGREYIYYKEKKDGVIHEGTKAEAIDVFRKSMIQKYDQGRNGRDSGETDVEIIYIISSQVLPGYETRTARANASADSQPG
jgi:hypothetical protein